MVKATQSERNQIRAPAEEAAKETAAPTIQRNPTGKNFSVHAVNPTPTYRAFHKHRRRQNSTRMCSRVSTKRITNNCCSFAFKRFYGDNHEPIQ